MRADVAAVLAAPATGFRSRQSHHHAALAPTVDAAGTYISFEQLERRYLQKRAADVEREAAFFRARAEGAVGGSSSSSYEPGTRGVRLQPKVRSGRKAWLEDEKDRLEANGFVVEDLPWQRGGAAKGKGKGKAWY